MEGLKWDERERSSQLTLCDRRLYWCVAQCKSPLVWRDVRQFNHVSSKALFT